MNPNLACHFQTENSLVDSPNVYMHSGVTIDGIGTWQHLVGFDGTGSNGIKPKLTKKADGNYSFIFRPSEFYNIASTEKVSQINLLFNNGSWSATARDYDNYSCADYSIPISASTISSIEISPINIIIDAITNSSKTFQITSNINWTAMSNQNWLTLSKDTGTGNAAITITVTANPTTIIRTAIVTISGTGVTAQTIAVTQDTGPTGINEISERTVSLFPDPATNELTINDISANASISIYDLNGKLLIYRIAKSTSDKINVSSLSTGVYSIKVTSKNTIKTGKLIKL